MPQRKYPFIKEGCYHVYNRGHNKQTIFLSNNDYVRYLNRLEEYLKRHSITLLAYCLMPNHIHLLLSQDTEESLEKFIHRLHTSYTMYFNKKYERVGAVFQGRFKAKPIDTDEYLLHVSRYVHINPLELSKKGQKLNLDRYPWSSYKEYVNWSKKSLSKPERILHYFYSGTKDTKVKNKHKYKLFVEDGLTKFDQSLFESISSGVLPSI